MRGQLMTVSRPLSPRSSGGRAVRACLLLWGVLLVAVACDDVAEDETDHQSTRDAVRAACRARETLPASESTSPLRFAAWLHQVVKDEMVLAEVERISVLPDRGRTMGRFAEENGVQHCPLAEYWNRQTEASSQR